MTKSAVARMARAEEYKVNRIVSRYEYHHFFTVMVFLFVIQDQRFPNRVVIITRFVRAGPRFPPPPPAPPPPPSPPETETAEEGKKRRKRIVNEGIILLGSTGSHFSLKLYSAFDVNIKMYIIPAHTRATQVGVRNTQEIMSGRTVGLR